MERNGVLSALSHTRFPNADNEDSVNLPWLGELVLADHPAGTGGNFDPSMTGVNSGYPRPDVVPHNVVRNLDAGFAFASQKPPTRFRRRNLRLLRPFWAAVRA